jgi:hypothetical protein
MLDVTHVGIIWRKDRAFDPVLAEIVVLAEIS